MNEKAGLKLRIAVKLDELSCFFTDASIVLLLVFIMSALFDTLSVMARGMGTVEFTDFADLMRVNPDTAGWLRIDGTHINHPVVQGKDDFEYLDLDFYRKYYAGGTLFLAAACRKDFSSEWNVIHGHHMAGGAMFGDLPKFLDKSFFDVQSGGVLFTPGKNYRLYLISAGTADAYEEGIYDPEAETQAHKRALRKASYLWKEKENTGSRILVLSTCTGDLNDKRTVVFFRMEHDPLLGHSEEDRDDG